MRNGETKCLGGLDVDDQLELGGLLHGEVAGLSALENPVHVSRRASKDLGITRPVGDQASRLDESPLFEHGGHPISERQLGEAVPGGDEPRIVDDQKSIDLFLEDSSERALEVGWASGGYPLDL